MKDLVLFSGSANPKLAAEIASSLDTKLGDVYLHTFPSGEKYCQLKENVRERDVFIIQSTGFPANDNLMELLIMVDAAKRASAERITVVIPSTPCYSRQDRKDKSRTPISAKLVANIITASGADRVLGMDFHCPQFAGFFDIPVDQLYAAPVFVKHLHENYPGSNLVVVSPDEGAVKRSSAFASSLKCDFAFHSKKRTGDTTVKSQGLIGNVKDKHVVLYDDLIESAGTLLEVSKICKAEGALSVTGLCTHNSLTDVGFERLSLDTYMDGLVLTNSNPHRYNLIEKSKIYDLSISTNKITLLSVAGLFAEAIKRIHNGESLSELFDIKGF